MRKSKILKISSYCIIPILILIIGLSVFYEIFKNSSAINIKDYTYFSSNEFLEEYMYNLINETSNLIYRNNEYGNIYDGDMRICFNEGNINSEYKLKDNYYIIIYKKLALTNVELSTDTDTIEEIKNFINQTNGLKANIINGVVEADSELLKNKAIKYFDRFSNDYYTITQKDNEEYVIDTNNSSQIIITEEGSNNTDNYIYENNIQGDIVRWYKTKIDDFEIYSCYKEQILEIEKDYFFEKLVEDLKYYDKQMVYAIPIASIILVIIFIYLIAAIGYTKEKEGIDFNDIDKIPIEIILGITGTVVIFILILMCEGMDIIDSKNYKLGVSLLLTGYFIDYILCAVTGVTIIKRIKAKKLIKESITGKIIILCWKVFKSLIIKLKKMLNKLKNSINKMMNSWSDISKVVIILFGYCLISIGFIMIFKLIGFIIALALGGVLLYNFLKNVNCFRKIENQLKEMYEGKHPQRLNELEFSKEFKDIVNYINDVSRGFENAIEEGIKSERLKTELITNVSHDIKTPLTSIINYIDLLKNENIDGEKAKEYIEVLELKSQRLKKLTEDLIEASKASSGNVKLNIERINIGELIKQTTGEFEDKFKQKNLEILSNIPSEEICINADNRYMYRIIENLFSNISKYALDSSRVYIDIKRIGNKARLTIKNISKERLNISSEELMQRFVRGDKSRTTEGSGLGISISKSLTEIQKGSFELHVDGDLFKVELEFEII